MAQVVRNLPHMHKALGSIPRARKKKKKTWIHYGKLLFLPGEQLALLMLEQL
jgi:hypothetical protein